MGYNEQLSNRIRELLIHQKNVTEKEMFSGVCFMVDDKMCICVNNDDILCRVGQEQASAELENGTCRQMIMGGRTSKDFVYVEQAEVQTQKKLEYWVALCLKFNPIAKASKRKKDL